MKRILTTLLAAALLAGGPARADGFDKALFESWGYTVSVVGESSNQSAYDAGIAAADVVFISETVNANQVGTKLANAPIGVVSQDGIYMDDLFRYAYWLSGDRAVADATLEIAERGPLAAVFSGFEIEGDFERLRVDLGLRSRMTVSGTFVCSMPVSSAIVVTAMIP